MQKKKKQKTYLLVGGLVLIAISMATGVLLFLQRYESLWVWYADTQKFLYNLENRIALIDKVWQFIGAIMLLYVIKSFVPIYTTSTVCFLTGVVLPIGMAIPINVIGAMVQFTIKYFYGKNISAGYPWKLISRMNDLKKLIQSDGKGNPALLAALRLTPCMPVNTISSIYGSFDFGYLKFLLISVASFLPKLVIFTFAGNNMFDPLSGKFLVPIILISFVSGISLLSVNGVWTVVEKILSRFVKKNKGETDDD